MTEAVAQRCSLKQVFLETPVKRLQHRCFPVNFAKFLRTPFHIEHLRRLLLGFVRSWEILRANRLNINFILQEKDKKRHIQYPVKHLRWSVLQKQLTAFIRELFLQNTPSQMFDRFFRKIYSFLNVFSTQMSVQN